MTQQQTNRDGWTKSTYSLSGNCLEMRATTGGIAVRDSKIPAAGTLAFTADDWARFVQRIPTPERR